ncbi:MAG: cobalt transporter CbiM [Desulfobacterales bacterium]|nr:cobalt transporter CbiM [Desulfobacterales bacterium]
MHISDGVLPIQVSIAAYGASIGIIGLSVYKTKGEDIPKIAVVTASFFVASLLHIPLGPTSVHLLIPGLVGILLYNSAFLAIALGLVLQCILFQFGGITALGANAIMMGIPALICGWIFKLLKGSKIISHTVVAAFCGGLGVILSTLFLSLLLFTGGENFIGVAKLAIVAHMPVLIIESIISAFTISFLYKVKPELIGVYKIEDIYE